MATELLSLFAKIGIDDKEYNKGIDGAESKASKLGKGLKTAFKVGAAAVGVTAGAVVGMSKKLTDGVKATAEYGDNVDKMSQKMGISAKAYQEWDAVMQHSGTSIEALKPSMKTLANQAEKNSDAFQKLGISQEEVATLSQEDLFAKTIEGLQNMEEGTERTALTAQLLGRGATELGALLNTSAEETQKMKDRVNELGGVMGDDAVKQAAKFQDQLQDMQTSFDGLKRNLLSEFMPAFTDVMSGFTEIFSGNTDEGIEQLSNGIQNIISTLTDKLPTLLDVGSNIILSIIDGITSNLPEMASAAVTTIVALTQGLIKQAPTILQAGVDIINALITGISENIGDIANAAVSVIGELAKSLSENIETLLPAITELISQIAIMLTNPDTLTSLLEAALMIITALANGFTEALPILMEALPQIISNLTTFLVNNIPTLLQAAITFFGALLQALPVIGEALLKSLGGLLGGLFAPIGEFFSGVFTSIGEFFANVWAKIVEFFQPLIDFVSPIFKALYDLFSSVFGAIKDIVTGIMKKVKNAISGPIEKAHNKVKDVLLKIHERFKNILSKIVKTVGKPIKTLKDKLSEPIDNFKKKIDDIKSKISTWGYDMLTNFRDGIVNGIKNVKDSLLGLLDWIKEHFHFSVPDVGPLADADKWMPDFMDLLASGIDDNKFKVVGAMDDLAGKMSLGGFDDEYTTQTEEDVQRFEFTFADGNAPLKQIARLLFPYMQVVAKEKGVKGYA